MQTLKQLIKDLASNQSNLKQQRKTVNLTVTRSVKPDEAAYSHRHNRTILREMNVAIGLLRGRSIEQIEGNAKEPVSIRAVNALKEKHAHEYRRDDNTITLQGSDGELSNG